MPVCYNCDKQLPDGSKFCPECGTPVKEIQGSGQEQRKQVFEGEIKKCPNCGEVLSAFEITCHACGIELRNRNGSQAIQKFAETISKLEATRPITPTKGSIFRFPAASPTDRSIASAIQSFVIPNTKEDIIEFILLAAASIDVDALDASDTSDGISRKVVANAWVAKFEQAYQKAYVTFGNSPDFASIKELHDRKSKEIRKARSRSIRILLFLMAMLLAISIFFPLFFSLLFR